MPPAWHKPLEFAVDVVSGFVSRPSAAAEVLVVLRYRRDVGGGRRLDAVRAPPAEAGGAQLPGELSGAAMREGVEDQADHHHGYDDEHDDAATTHVTLRVWCSSRFR